MQKIRLGVIGLGARGLYLTAGNILKMDQYEVTAVCDVYRDRIDRMNSYVKASAGKEAFGTEDYREILAMDNVDAVLISTSWEDHVKIAVDAMKAGKAVGLEVGGAYSVDDCFRLVRTQVETGAKFMFLENCCFGRVEMAVLNMVRQGIFGEVVHCEGGYEHDLRDQILKGEENRHYRLRNYTARNCDNYPTHQLGPISRVLNINKGNRMLYLTSMASKSKGLNDFAKMNPDKYQSKYVDWTFNQGDVIRTSIMCADGATISLKLNTTCSRPYSRNFGVQGTRAVYNEDGRFFHLDALGMSREPDYSQLLNNQDEFLKKYEHPVWQSFLNDGVKGGHGGMDWLMLEAFADYIVNGGRSPIDVYDAAAWMCITPLSEISIKEGSRPVEIPDFTTIK